MEELKRDSDGYPKGTCGDRGRTRRDGSVYFTPIKTPSPDCEMLVPARLAIIVDPADLGPCQCDD